MLVTGACGAVGSAVVNAIVDAGGQVIATDIAADRTHDIDDTRVRTIKLDVLDPDGWAQLSAEIARADGGLDGLVTCAAILHDEDGGIDDMTDHAWSRTHAVNVTGAMLASRAAVPLMRLRGGGSIVHVGSIAATRGSAASHVAYSASKGAVAAMTRDLAVAHALDHIRVNTVAAGLLATTLTEDLVATPEEFTRRMAHIPAGRLGLAPEVASAVVWLLAEGSSYVTGAELAVDGGLTAAFVTGRESRQPTG